MLAASRRGGLPAETWNDTLPWDPASEVALVEMRSSSWIFMAQSLNDFTNKGKSPIEGDIHPSSGCLADCLVMVSGHPRIDRLAAWRVMLVPSCYQHHYSQGS